MPTQSPTLRVHVTQKGRRRTYELTAAQERALTTVADDGAVLDSVPFATARSLVAKGLLCADGARWFRTALGVQVAQQARAKRRAGR